MRVLLAALLLAGVALAPAASADPTCTGYVNVQGTKQRSCVDPERAPTCPAWTEGWSSIGYFRTCYGTAVLCNPYGCILDEIVIGGCIERVCP